MELKEARKKNPSLEPNGAFSYLKGMKTASLFISVLAIFLFVLPLAQAKPDFTRTFGKWHVQTFVEGRSKVCLIWSQPYKSKGNYKRRGDIFAYVTQDPAQKRLEGWPIPQVRPGSRTADDASC